MNESLQQRTSHPARQDAALLELAVPKALLVLEDLPARSAACSEALLQEIIDLEQECAVPAAQRRRGEAARGLWYVDTKEELAETLMTPRSEILLLRNSATRQLLGVLSYQDQCEIVPSFYEPFRQFLLKERLSSAEVAAFLNGKSLGLVHSFAIRPTIWSQVHVARGNAVKLSQGYMVHEGRAEQVDLMIAIVRCDNPALEVFTSCGWKILPTSAPYVTSDLADPAQKISWYAVTLELRTDQQKEWIRYMEYKRRRGQLLVTDNDPDRHQLGR